MRARFCERRLCKRLLQLKPDAHLLDLRCLPLQALRGKGWNFLRFLRNRRFLLRYFAMRPQNTRSANLQKRCLVNFRCCASVVLLIFPKTKTMCSEGLLCNLWSIE
jgi:hypothetical protein